MKLPNARLAVVERSKIVDYLLNAGHPDNSGKAAFFRSRGYSKKGWRGLAAALQDLAASSRVSKIVEIQHGLKYVLNGHLRSPSGKPCLVRTVWIKLKDETAPSFITALPTRNGEDDQGT